MATSPQPVLRPVRSFVRREGRMTPAQERALDRLSPAYVVGAGGRLDFAALFGRRAPVAVEIGFGDGQSLVEMASNCPDTDYVGIEVYRPGIGRLLLQLEKRGITNVRVVAEDALQVLDRRLPLGSLDALMVFFPDPWPKKRHHKRRLIQPGFVAMAVRLLRPGGLLHLATDWQDYAQQMLAVLTDEPGLRNTVEDYAPRPAYRPLSKYERRGQALGHAVWDLLFERIDAEVAP